MQAGTFPFNLLFLHGSCAWAEVGNRVVPRMTAGVEEKFEQSETAVLKQPLEPSVQQSLLFFFVRDPPYTALLSVSPPLF